MASLGIVLYPKSMKPEFPLFHSRLFFHSLIILKLLTTFLEKSNKLVHSVPHWVLATTNLSLKSTWYFLNHLQFSTYDIFQRTFSQFFPCSSKISLLIFLNKMLAFPLQKRLKATNHMIFSLLLNSLTSEALTYLIHLIGRDSFSRYSFKCSLHPILSSHSDSLLHLLFLYFHCSSP